MDTPEPEVLTYELLAAAYEHPLLLMHVLGELALDPVLSYPDWARVRGAVLDAWPRASSLRRQPRLITDGS